MAEPNPRRVATLGFSGGYIIGAAGLLEYLFGELDFEIRPIRPGGKYKRPYGSRQRANARAGERFFIRLDDGSVHSVRITSTQTSFIGEMLASAPNKVLEMWSERGTVYRKDYAELGATP